jgi:hypothetical protein
MSYNQTLPGRELFPEKNMLEIATPIEYGVYYNTLKTICPLYILETCCAHQKVESYLHIIITLKLSVPRGFPFIKGLSPLLKFMQSCCFIFDFIPSLEQKTPPPPHRSLKMWKSAEYVSCPLLGEVLNTCGDMYVS